MPAELFLVSAILFEVLGTILMKLSHGFEVLWASLLMVFSYALSFISLTFCLKKMEFSIAYGIWSALGTVLIALTGVVYFDERMTIGMVSCLVLIIAGVAILGFKE